MTTTKSEPVRIETVGGLNQDYYRVLFPGSTVTTTYGLTEVGMLKARVSGQTINWVKGKNVFEGVPMTDEKFHSMITHYEEA